MNPHLSIGRKSKGRAARNSDAGRTTDRFRRCRLGAVAFRSQCIFPGRRATENSGTESDPKLSFPSGGSVGLEKHGSAPIETVEVPVDAIAEETLFRLVEAYVLREGTDYGAEDALFETKVRQVLRQLRDGSARLLFVPGDESFVLVPSTERSGARARRSDGAAEGPY